MGVSSTLNLTGFYSRVGVTGSENGNTIRVHTGADKLVWVMALGGGDDINTNTGRGATIYGGPGSDIIVGSQLADVIEGGTEDDRINAESGDDLILGDGGNDEITCGYGNDTADGGLGNDLIAGGIESEGIEDRPDGYVDTVRFATATTGVVVRLGTSMNNDGAGGMDFISKRVENVIGTPFNDYIQGSDVNNQIWGMDGNDTTSGGTGNDTCYGGAGADRLYGGGDDDELIGGSGSDFFDGGTGHDRAFTDFLELPLNVEEVHVTGGWLLT
jgi:Ca2+-binding RTX toxin-like protein